jgi:cytochrome c biogenesis protein CcdA
MLKYFSPIILPFVDAMNVFYTHVSVGEQQERKKAEKVFFLHTKIVSNSRSSAAAPILLLT